MYNFDYRPLNGQTRAEAEAPAGAVLAAWDQWLAAVGRRAPSLAAAGGGAWGGADCSEQGLGVRGGRSGIGLKIREGNVSHTVSLFFALIAWSDQQRNLTVYPDFPSY
jgi:hypothetical protein